MKVVPLGSRLLIKPYEEEKRTSGGIVLPDAAKEKQMTAKVIAVGEKVEDIDVKRKGALFQVFRNRDQDR